MKDHAIRGHICYSADRQELTVAERSWLVCRDGICAGVFEELPPEHRELPRTDYGDRLIIPGMVDLHTHAPQLPFRGMCMDLELMDWLEQYTFPEEEKYRDPAYAEQAYTRFARTLKLGATTRAVIFATCHREATVTLMELMEATGLVSYVGKVNMDRQAPEGLREKSPLEAAADTRRWLAEVKGRFARTMPILTPRFIPSCTDALMEQLGEIRREWGLPVQSHLSENPGEIELVRALRPQSRCYGAAYDEHGLFGADRETGAEVRTVMAHCVWSTPEEVDLMEKNGVFIAHCPGSNMNLSSGIAPVRRYLDRGLRVGLGTDMAGGHSDSIFRAITDAVQLSKLYWRHVDRDCPAIRFPEAFYMATKGGGRFFGRVGSFEPGYEFDALVLEDGYETHPRPLTVLQRLERAVYLSLDGSGIGAKYVQGVRIL